MKVDKNHHCETEKNIVKLKKSKRRIGSAFVRPFRHEEIKETDAADNSFL